MSDTLTRAEDVGEYCPACLSCVADDPDECPECGRERYRRGWKPLELAPHAYLGYEIHDRYLLDRYLGGGASGEVYRAIDRKLDRPFALKIVDMEQYSREERREEHVKRFENEVQALSRLRNPHVINIYESFQLDEHTSALLTEYVDGVTLEDMLEDSEVLEFDRLMMLARQVANGLHEAHQEGVVHRDVKPGNIMIEELPAAGFFARILDFGLVHMIEDGSMTRGFRGTPLYAAPEQCATDVGVDHRADVYALGCVLFHCLVGEPPFYGTDAVKIIESHISEDPPRLNDELPSARHVPDVIEDLMDQMLQKNPDDRPEHLREVIEVLDDVASSNRDPRPSAGASSSPAVEDGTSSVSSVPADAPVSKSSTALGVGLDAPESSQQAPAEVLQGIELEEVEGTFSGEPRLVRLEREGSCVLAADEANQVLLISRGERGYADVFPGPETRLTGMTANLNRGLIYASELNGTVYRWFIGSGGREPEEVASFSDRILDLDVDGAGNRLVMCTERGRLLTHDVRTGRTAEWQHRSSPAARVRISADGSSILFGTIGGTIGRLDGEADDPDSEEIATLDAEPRSLEVDPRMDRAAVVDRDGCLAALNLRERKVALKLEQTPEHLQSVAFASEEQLLGLTVEGRKLRFWAFHHAPMFHHSVA